MVFINQNLVKIVLGMLVLTITGGGIYLASSISSQTPQAVSEDRQISEVISAQTEIVEEELSLAPTVMPTQTKKNTPTPTSHPTQQPTSNPESNNTANSVINPPTAAPTQQQPQANSVALEACFTHSSDRKYSDDTYYFYDEVHLDASCSKSNIIEYKWVIGKTRYALHNEAYGKNVAVRFEIPANTWGQEIWKNFLDPSAADVMLTVTDNKGGVNVAYERIKLEVPEDRQSEKWW